MTEPTTPDGDNVGILTGTTGVKPGVKTSEFWATLTSFVIFVLPALHIVAAPETVRAVMGAMAAFVVAAYALARTIVKAAHENKPVTTLPPIEAAPATVKRAARAPARKR